MTTTTKKTTKTVKAKATPIPNLPKIPFAFEVFDAVSKQRTKAKKIEVLQRYAHDSIMALMIWNFDETAISVLPQRFLEPGAADSIVLIISLSATDPINRGDIPSFKSIFANSEKYSGGQRLAELFAEPPGTIRAYVFGNLNFLSDELNHEISGPVTESIPAIFNCSAWRSRVCN